MATPQQPLQTKPLPQSPTDTTRDPRSHGAAWVSYRSQATELPQLSKAFRLAAAKFSRPPSRAAAELRNSTNHVAYTWHVVVRELSQHPMLSGAALPASPVYTPSSTRTSDETLLVGYNKAEPR